MMKKIISLMLAMTSALAALAQGGSGQGYDPVNPPDPQAGHRLTVKVAPEKGGTTDPSRPMYIQQGEGVWLYAYEKLGYEFRAWMEGDSIISNDKNTYYSMPEKDVVLTAWFDKVDFNPANPGDPFLDGYTHKVNVYTTPSNAGWVNNNNFLLREGDETVLYAYTNSNYKFSCWKQDGKIISTSPELPIRMGQKNLEYTAQYAYDPADPADPWPNSWNEATGELIIDHFEPGGLWSAIESAIDGAYDAVSSITVIGQMDSYDLGVVRNLPQITSADFSRTHGYDYVPDWIFENCAALTKVLLPSSIASISSYAFYDCQNLSELVVYAAMPPYVGYEAFHGVPENLVVKVYSNSLELYSAADVWSNYKIMTIDEDSTALSVTLPDDAADGRYRNASLQLSNLSTGQTQKLVITGNRVKFIFGNLIPELKYSLYVLAPNGNVIGSYLDFEMPKEGLDYKIPSLLQLQEVKLALTTPEGADVAPQAAISWFDEKHTFLGSGEILAGQVEGYDVAYEIVLPRELAIIYEAPANASFRVKSSGNDIKIPLKALATGEIKGVLTDSSTGEPVAGGFVTVSQTVNGNHTVSATATTGKDGSYTLTVYDAEGTLTAGSPEHIEDNVPFASLEEAKKNGNLSVKPLYGTEITLSLLSRDNIVKGSTDNAFSEYEDYANVSFEAVNLTKNEPVDLRLRYPRLLLLGEVADGDRIEIKATPRNSAFNPASEIASISGGKGDAKITFTSNGDIAASYGASEAEEVVALLYDEAGKLMKNANYVGNNASFKGLADGKYTLVSMASSKLFSTAGTLAELNDSRLTAGTDYAINEVSVETGYISKVEIPVVPVFDETMFYYTGAETSVSVNKTSVTVGSIVTVRSKVDFLPEYAPFIEKVNIIFSIPEGCDYVDNSLLVAGNGANFTTLSDGRLSVEVPVRDASPRFCIIPRKGGEYRPSAMIEFEYNGEIIRQPIGSALFSAGDFTLSVPEKTSVTQITARGAATPLSEVKVYDNNVFIGSTRTLTNGDWRLRFDLFNPGDYSEHFIYAEITTPEGVKYTTTTGKTIYDKDWAELTDIEMIYGGTTVDFNHIDATTIPGSYSYVPGNDMFTFKAIFREEHAPKVEKLDFVILLSDGSRRRIDGKFLKGTGTWVCALGFDDVNRLPVNVKVLYREVRDTVKVELVDVVTDPFRCPDVIPIIDPSGYVYEAVPSNRVEGVMATIFYKEWVEDMYGDVKEEVIKWDAEAYAQQNPLFTDADGMYQWDVPQGEWQVRFEKEGYEAAQTEWLPVPPPQLDVNVGMTRNVRPEVKSARAFESAVEVEFDKYMTPSTLTTASIVVTVNGEPVNGNLFLLDDEENPEGDIFASAVRFEAETPFNAETVTLMVAGQVRSYAGIRMEETFMQEFTVEPEIKEISAEAEMDAYVGENGVVSITAAPAEAAAGKKLIVSVSSPIVAVNAPEALDANGSARISFSGELPGTVYLTFSIEDSQVASASTKINLTVKPEMTKAPEASLPTESLFMPGQTVELTSATESAEIWYTTDGSSPLENGILYTEPIVLTETVTIKAMAVAEGHLDSEVVTFEYMLDPISGIGSTMTDALSVRPLASNDGFIIEAAEGQAVSVAVYDAAGQMVMASQGVAPGTTVSMADTAPGIYVVKAVANGKTATLKFRKR